MYVRFKPVRRCKHRKTVSQLRNELMEFLKLDDLTDRQLAEFNRLIYQLTKEETRDKL